MNALYKIGFNNVVVLILDWLCAVQLVITNRYT